MKVTNIFLYSRLNPLVTVHQLSDDLPLSWVDTAFQLPLPRRDSSLPTASPTLGLVIIPSNVILNNEEIVTPEETCFTTYRLQPDLSIVGDMYGTQDTEIKSFAMKSFVKRTETLSARLTTDAESESEKEWSPYQSKRKLDFSLVAEQVLSHTLVSDPIKKGTQSRLKTQISETVKQSEFCFETMYFLHRNEANSRRNWKSTEMIAADPDSLTSTIEQVGHNLQEEGYQVKPLHIIPSNQEFDPEDDPGSISSIYSKLISKLPSRGLVTSDITSKLHSIRDIAVDVGLANIGVAKPNPSDESASLRTLRNFLHLDPAIEISTPAKFIVGEWGVIPEPAKPKQGVTRKRKRARIAGSLNIATEVAMSQPGVERDENRMSMFEIDTGAGVTMSQPERGTYGAMTLRNLRKKSVKAQRRAGF